MKYLSGSAEHLVPTDQSRLTTPRVKWPWRTSLFINYTLLIHIASFDRWLGAKESPVKAIKQNHQWDGAR